MTDYSDSKGLTRQHIQLIVGGIIAILAIILLFQNSQEVTFYIWFWELKSSLILLLLLTFFLGAFGVFIIMFLQQRKRKRTIKRLTKELEQAQQELSKTRDLIRNDLSGRG